MSKGSRASNVSSRATTADHVRSLAHQPPPRRTVRADFPHTALRQSLATRHLRGVEDRHTLQVQKSITLQSRVQSLSSPERLAPSLAPSLGLAAEFPSQQGDLLRHTGLRTEPLCHPIRSGALFAQAVSPSLDRNVTEVWPLRSTPFPGLPYYYGPLRLPAAATSRVMDSPRALSSQNATPGLPGSSTDPSARAPLNHPGRPSRCLCSFLPCWWQASPHLEGWPPPSQCNEAESGSLALGLTPSLSGEDHSPSPLLCTQKDRPYFPCLVTLCGRPQLHGERATAMVETFHSTGSARLGPA